MAVALIATALGSGCSMKQMAVNTIGDMLSSGDSIFERDDDLVLIGDALPFSLKLMESLLAESPNNRGLLLASCRGYVLYTYAYVQFPADQARDHDLEQARALRVRARRLYQRAIEFAMRAWETTHPQFRSRLRDDPAAAARLAGTDDVPLLYWTAAALGLGISVSKDDAAMLARLPEVEALLDRGLDLDEAWDGGALHEFEITWAAAQRLGVDKQTVTQHYRRALALSGGTRAGLYVAFAEATAVPAQDREAFRSLLAQALAVDLDADPDHRLANAIAQRRARWLLGRIDELFL